MKSLPSRFSIRLGSFGFLWSSPRGVQSYSTGVRSSSPPPPHFSVSDFASLAPASLALRAACGRLPRERPLSGGQRFRFCQGSSLVTTLLVVTVLTIIVVAFMTSMSIERKTSQSYANMERARLAAEAGMARAVADFSEAIGTNQSYSVYLDTSFQGSPLLAIQRGQTLQERNDEGEVSSYILSGEPALRSNPLASVDINSREIIQLRSTMSDTNSFRSPWQNLESEAGTVISRFAFVVTDDAARFRPALHGTNAVRDNATNWFTDPEQLPIAWGTNSAISIEDASALKTISYHVPTRQTLAQALGSRAEFEKIKHLVTDVDSLDLEVIPGGYPEAGSPKYPINAIVNDTDYASNNVERINAIVEVIETNLPDFSLREPTLSGHDSRRYLERVAANIIDYIDTDSQGTLLASGEPSGRDLMALPVAIAERYRRTAFNGTLTPATTTVENQVFLQVWNPYMASVQINGSVRVVLKNRMKVTFGTAIVAPFAVYDQTIPVNLTIRPNEFVVFEFPAQEQTWTSPDPATAPSFVANSPSNSADSTTHPHFEFYVNDQLYDLNRRPPVGPGVAHGGTPRYSRTLSNASNHWQASFIPNFLGGGGRRAVADPRFHFLSNYQWQTLSNDDAYRNTTRWKGRQADPESTPRSQDYRSLWANRSFVRENPSVGQAPGNINTSPSMVETSYEESIDANNAPLYLKNNNMNSSAEFGHIFDPAQVDDSGLSPQAQTAGAGSVENPFAAGGGRSLRVGQPEFSYWDQEGRRAIHLLDLFTVHSPPDKDEFSRVEGRININTAQKEVLESLFIGINPRSDAVFTQPTISEEGAKRIAQAIIENRPYHKISDLYPILPFLQRGDTFTPPMPLVPEANVNDPDALAVMNRAREEIFGKAVEHITVTSRAFRVYVIGQAIDPLGNPQSQTWMEGVVTVGIEEDGSPKVELVKTFTH